MLESNIWDWECPISLSVLLTYEHSVFHRRCTFQSVALDHTKWCVKWFVRVVTLASGVCFVFHFCLNMHNQRKKHICRIFVTLWTNIWTKSNFHKFFFFLQTFQNVCFVWRSEMRALSELSFPPHASQGPRIPSSAWRLLCGRRRLTVARVRS